MVATLRSELEGGSKMNTLMPMGNMIRTDTTILMTMDTVKTRIQTQQKMRATVRPLDLPTHTIPNRPISRTIATIPLGTAQKVALITEEVNPVTVHRMENQNQKPKQPSNTLQEWVRRRKRMLADTVEVINRLCVSSLITNLRSINYFNPTIDHETKTSQQIVH